MNDDTHALGPIMQILVPVSDVDRASDFYAFGLMREAPKGLERG